MLNFLAAKMEASKIAALIFAGVFALLLVVSIIITIIAKNKKVPYDKDGFVHKVLKHNHDIFKQIASFSELVLFIAAVVVYFVNFKHHYIVAAVLLGVCVLIVLADLWVKFQEKRSRIEYNKHGLYQYKVFGKPKEILWKDLKDVKAVGMGRNRIYNFKGKKNVEITVPFNMVGAYEFTVFCEKQLDGKQFEEIKIGKARQ